MTIPLTVALLTRNRSHYLKQSLAAIIGQTYRDFELLVLDNGSTDDTAQVVLACGDPRLRYIRNPPGHGAIFNAASAQWIARGQLLLVTHDDDIMEADMLARQMTMFDAQPELTAIWTNKSIIDADGNTVQRWFSAPGADRVFAPGEFIARAAVENLWHPPSSLMFRHRLLPRASLRRKYLGLPGGGTPPEGGSDLLAPALLNLAGPVAFLNAPLLRYRQHGGQETHRIHVAQVAIHSYRTLRKHLRRTAYRREYEPLYDAQICRFQAQELVVEAGDARLGARRIDRLARMLGRATAGIDANPRAGHLLLPLMILLLQHGVVEPVARIMAAMGAPDPTAPRSVHALHRWCRLRQDGVNLFGDAAAPQRIAILGSVFISALLIHEAREAGVHVVCCLDSNGTRQGRDWLGVPIHAPAWLATAGGTVDSVLLSPERDHESELVEFIHAHDRTATVASWKDLVDTAQHPAGHGPGRRIRQ